MKRYVSVLIANFLLSSFQAHGAVTEIVAKTFKGADGRDITATVEMPGQSPQPGDVSISIPCPSQPAIYKDQTTAFKNAIAKACDVGNSSCTRTTYVNLGACRYYLVGPANEFTHLTVQRKKNLVIRTNPSLSSQGRAGLVMVHSVDRSVLTAPSPSAGKDVSTEHRRTMQNLTNYRHKDGIAVIGSAMVQFRGVEIWFQTHVVDAQNTISDTSLPKDVMRYFSYGRVQSSDSKKTVIAIEAPYQKNFDPTFRNINEAEADGTYLWTAAPINQHSDRDLPEYIDLVYDYSEPPYVKVKQVIIPEDGWGVGRRVKFNHSGHGGGRGIRIGYDTNQLLRSSNISIVNVILRNVGSNPIVAAGMSGGLYINGAQVLELESGLKNSSTGGGIILTDIGQNIILENNTLLDIGDDGFNIKPSAQRVISATYKSNLKATSVLIEQNAPPLYEQGKLVCFYHENFTYMEQNGSDLCATVNSWNATTGELLVNGDFRIVTAGKIVVNEAAVPNKLYMRNNRVSFNRARGILVNARDASIETNRITGSSLGGIWLLNENAGYLQGAFIRNVKIYNNTIENVGAYQRGAAIMVSANKDLAFNDRVSIQTVRIVANTFTATTRVPGLVVSSTSDLVVRDNQMIAPGTARFKAYAASAPEWRHTKIPNSIPLADTMNIFYTCNRYLNGNVMGGMPNQNVYYSATIPEPVECPRDREPPPN